MQLGSLLSTVAPWISAATLGPLGGVAVDALAKVLGLTDVSESALKKALGTLSEDKLSALKEADAGFAIRMQSLWFENAKALEELAVKDRDSARNREVQLKDWTPRLLAFLIMFGFFGMAYGVLFNQMSADSILAGTVIGYLSAKAEQVVAYYFGSTAGSARKTELLGRSTPPSI